MVCNYILNSNSSFELLKLHNILGGGNPFQNIEKTTVLQEARIFNETSVNPRKCTPILSKLLYMLNQVKYAYVFGAAKYW